MTIGQKRNLPPQSTTGKDTGPGAYDPDKAQALTRPKSKSAMMNKSKRPDNFAKKE